MVLDRDGGPRAQREPTMSDKRGACSCSALRGALYLSDYRLNGTFIALTGHRETEPTGGFPIGRRDEDPENVQKVLQRVVEHNP